MMSSLEKSALDLGQLDAAMFAQFIDSSFILESGASSQPVILVDCREKPEAAGPDSARTPFSLLLRAEPDPGHPLQEIREFHGNLHGLEEGVVSGVLVQRTLRPATRPAGIYFQIVFN